MKKLLKNKQLLGLAVLSILAVLMGGMLAPIEMRYLSKVVGGNTLASFIFTAGTIASILGSVWLSQLANTYGRKRLLFTAMVITVFMPLLYANIQTILQAYGIKFAWVLALAGMGTVMRAFIQEEVSGLENLQGTFFGIFYSLQAGAGAVGAVFGGYISDKFGFRGVFYTVFALGIVQFLILVISFCRSMPSISQAESPKSKGNIIEGAKFIWFNRALRARFILITAFGINWSTKAILYPLIIYAVSGTDVITGAVMATQGIAAMIVLPYIGRIVDKVGYSEVLWFGYTVLGVGVMVFSLTPYLWLIWAAACLVAVGEACNGPALGALEVKNIPDYLRNSVVAVQDVYTTVVELLAVSITGLLLIFMVPRGIMLLMAAAVFAALLLSLITLRKPCKG